VNKLLGCYSNSSQYFSIKHWSLTFRVVDDEQRREDNMAGLERYMKGIKMQQNEA